MTRTFPDRARRYQDGKNGNPLHGVGRFNPKVVVSVTGCHRRAMAQQTEFSTWDTKRSMEK